MEAARARRTSAPD